MPIPEGVVIVKCPYCDLRSVVKGENGIRRYQVPSRVNPQQVEIAFQQFLSGNMAIAPGTREKSRVTEIFQVHLPFWAVWGKTLGWVFGEKEVGSGDNRHYEPREVKIVEEMTWNAAACEVGEFGVDEINLDGRPLEPFASDLLHSTGMVFEPVGSSQDALQKARENFRNRVQEKADLDRQSQVFVKISRPRLGLVYYPLWVVRYTCRERSFQVVVDGFTGQVLYGKAPGNVFYRAAALVGGMAVGSFLAIDVPGMILSFSSSNDDIGGTAILVFLVGMGIMYGAYRIFRYGEHYEYRRKSSGGFLYGIPGSSGGLKSVVRTIRRFQ
ncbi:MAG: hypothetical protein AB9891_07855 [Anaerolineaceae bacterium]